MNHHEYIRELKKVLTQNIDPSHPYLGTYRAKQTPALPQLAGMPWRHQQSFMSIEKFEGHYKECLHPHGTA
jgi:hypothetical protein